MLKKEIDSIISSKVKEIADKIDNKIYEIATNNPEYFIDWIKIPVNQIFTTHFEQIDSTDEYGEDTYYTREGYEVDFSESRDWRDIGRQLIEYYKQNGFILKLLLIEEQIDYITQKSIWYNTYWDEILEGTTASKLARVNYLTFERLELWNPDYPLFKIPSIVSNQIQTKLKWFIEEIDKKIVLEISQNIQMRDWSFIYPAEEIFNFDSYSIKISDYTWRRQDYEWDINNTPFWHIYWKGLREYYCSQWYDLTIQYKDNEEANTLYSYHPLFEWWISFQNYVQIKKIWNRVKEKKLLFLDTEVHDLKSPILIQLAYKDSDTGESFSKYYSTSGVPISDGAMWIHHITEKMIEWKDIFETSWDKSVLQNLLNEKILVAHNSKFDIWVLKSVGMDVSRSICTLKVAHYLYPSLENYKLQTLRYTLKLELDWEINPHDAMSDVLVLEKLFWKFYEEMGSKLETTDSTIIIDEMIDISSRPILLDTITFWKHKWDKWSSVPKSYLDWILNKSDLGSDEDISYTCRYYIKWEDKSNLTDNMFEKAWKHPRQNNIPAIEKDSTIELGTNHDNQSGAKIFGIFLILIVVMVLISVLF